MGRASEDSCQLEMEASSEVLAVLSSDDAHETSSPRPATLLRADFMTLERRSKALL